MRGYIFYSFALLIAVTVLAILITHPPIEKKQPITIKEGMSLRHISERNDVSLHALIPVMTSEDRKDFLTTFRNMHKPIGKLDIDRDEIRRAILEARAQGYPTKNLLKFILWTVSLTGAGLLLLRKRNLLRVRRIWLILTFTVFGIILGTSPNPMEATVRLHKLFKGIPGNPVILVILSFIIFTLMSLIGSRMLCSWGCPLGALQESLHNVPAFKRFKKNHKLSFSASISVRITLYLLFFLLLFGILNINQGGPGSILYHHFNLFKIFNPYELASFTVLLIPVFVITSLFIFRPFCHTICPFGLWAWLFEKASLYKVRKVIPRDCADCKICEDACPTDAMKAINENKNGFFRPDCWSCGKCIAVCPQGVLEYASTSKKL